MKQPKVLVTQNGLITISAEEMEWIDEEKIRKDELIALIVPPRNNRWCRMPVYKYDTLQTVAERWVRMYPSESSAMIAEAKAHFAGQLNENGMSQEKLVQKLLTVPDMIYWAMYHIDSDFWNKNNMTAYNKFKELLPVLASKCSIGKASVNYSMKEIEIKRGKNDQSEGQKPETIIKHDSEGRNNNIRKGIEISSTSM
jgi:hypothetical protein